MKYLGLLALCCALWLPGCASLPSDEAVRPDGARAPEASQPMSQWPGAPRNPPTGLHAGPLLPITLGQIGSGSRAVAALEPPVDLWDRIRRGFAMPDLDSPLVRDREQWYTTRPDYIYRMTERSRKYLFHIVEELELRNMPTELALLPFIESAFNPQAVSVAKAAGMWQFMPATGKTFDLKQNVFRDDRRDVLASTRAALDYLQKLYTLFGDWHLALAAYNWGEGSVGRAIAKNQKAGQPTGYTDLVMPMETRFYVPKLQAMKNIVAQPGGFESRLPDIPNHPYFQTVTLSRDIDVSVAARLAEISEEDFRSLNPSAHRPVILAAGTPQILLPWDNATVFQRNLEATPGRLASWTAWIAPSTLRPADAAARVGMSEKDLRAVNNIPARMLIKAGSTLLVPRPGHVEDNVAVHVADNGQMALAPEIVTRRTLVKVNKGDTLASLAHRHGLSASAVAEWNKLSLNATLKPGQQLQLMLPVRSTATAQPSRPVTRQARARPVQRRPAARPVRTARR